MVKPEEIVFGNGNIPEHVIYRRSARRYFHGQAAWRLTILEINRLGVVGPPHHGELDLLETLALEPRPLFQPLLRFGERLALPHVSLLLSPSPRHRQPTSLSKNLKGMPWILLGSFWKWKTWMNCPSSASSSSSGMRSA